MNESEQSELIQSALDAHRVPTARIRISRSARPSAAKAVGSIKASMWKTPRSASPTSPNASRSARPSPAVRKSSQQSLSPAAPGVGALRCLPPSFGRVRAQPRNRDGRLTETERNPPRHTHPTTPRPLRRPSVAPLSEHLAPGQWPGVPLRLIRPRHFLMPRDILRLQRCQKRQVAVHVLVVEPVPNDELIWNIEPDKIRRVINLLSPILPQQHRRANRGRLKLAHFFHRPNQCVARVEDIVHQQHIATRNI